MTKHKKDMTLVVCLMLSAIVVACCGIFWFSRGKPREICQPIMLDSPGELTSLSISGSGKPTTAIRMTDDMTMVYIPAGDFEMGLEDGNDDEQPVHTVYLDAYWIDQTEVTNSQYQKCVAAGVCTHPYFNDNVITNFIFKNNTTRIRNEYFYNSALAQHPVVWVRWEQAQTYCHWVGGRFPTEAEWEKAARGTDGREYPWGDEFFGNRVNFCDKNGECQFPDSDWDDGYQDTAPVGSYPDGASPYGVLDMAGNVSEWVADLFEYDYYVNSPRANPTGPTCAEKRLLRGGSLGNIASNVRSTRRDEVNARWHSDSFGFRCAASAEGYQSQLDSKDPVVINLRDITAPTSGFQEMTGILPPGTQVNGVGILSDGTAWIYGDHGIYSIDLLGNIRLVFDQPVLKFLAADLSGQVWIIGGGGEFMAAYDGQAWQIYGPEQGWGGLPDRPYLSPGVGSGLTQDPQGLIWLATGTDTLRVYEPAADTWQELDVAQLGFSPYDNQDYQGYFTTDTLVSGSGDAWVSACIGEGEVLQPFGIWYNTGGPWLELEGTGQDCILDMATGTDGVIWAGGFDSLMQYGHRQDSWTRIPLPEFDRRQIVSRILINPTTGLPWIQVVRYGGASIYGSLAYYHLNPSGWVLDMESPSFSDIGTAFEPDGTAWMCGDGQVMKSDGTVLNEVAKLNLIDCQITIDGAGRVWVVGVDQADLWMLNIGLD